MVLSGGGARGAYAVGVVQAIVEVLGLCPPDPSPFVIYSGTCVCSINATYFTANAHRGDVGIYRLRELWCELGVNSHLQMRNEPSTLRNLTGGWFSRSLLDSKPLQALVRQHLSFEDVHRNIASGVVCANMVAAFNISTSQTTVFCEKHPRLRTRPPHDPWRVERLGELRAEQSGRRLSAW